MSRPIGPKQTKNETAKERKEILHILYKSCCLNMISCEFVLNRIDPFLTDEPVGKKKINREPKYSFGEVSAEEDSSGKNTKLINCTTDWCFTEFCCMSEYVYRIELRYKAMFRYPWLSPALVKMSRSIGPKTQMRQKKKDRETESLAIIGVKGLMF